MKMKMKIQIYCCLGKIFHHHHSKRENHIQFKIRLSFYLIIIRFLFSFLFHYVQENNFDFMFIIIYLFFSSYYFLYFIFWGKQIELIMKIMTMNMKNNYELK
jgi:hypothetical protein